MLSTNRRRARVAFLVAIAVVVVLYIPPLGRHVVSPELVALLAPETAHSEPTLIETGSHVYYRVRLNRPVPPWYAHTYLESLRRRGVQYAAMGTSAFAPGGGQQTGWQFACARRLDQDPLAIEYWHSTDYSASYPVSLRWPWLYLRLGRDVLQRHVKVLLPSTDQVHVDAEIPRYPGSVLTDIIPPQVSGFDFVFMVKATQAEVIGYFASRYPASMAQASPSVLFLRPVGVREPALANSVGFEIEVTNTLFDDFPLRIYPLELASRLTSSDMLQQPQDLRDLPTISRYKVSFGFQTPAAAKLAFTDLAAQHEGLSQQRGAGER